MNGQSYEQWRSHVLLKEDLDKWKESIQPGDSVKALLDIYEISDDGLVVAKQLTKAVTIEKKYPYIVGTNYGYFDYADLWIRHRRAIE